VFTLSATRDDLPDRVRDAFADPPSGTELTARASGYVWQLLEWGDVELPPVLMVHGVTSNKETFWRVGPAIAAAGRHVVAVDLPGHGRTGGWQGRHRWLETATDLAGCIRAARLEVPNLVVVGHSWGAITAAHLPLTGLRPDRLILLDPPALTVDELVPLMQSPTERRYDDVAEAIAAVRSSAVGWSERDIEAKAVALTQIDAAAVRAIYLDNGDYDAALGALSDSAAAGIATWIIRGDPSGGGLIPDENLRALSERIGHDHIVTIVGAGHSPQRTHPEATIVAILRALQARRAGIGSART
jgi:pimeloyl-ACP methyl ester carboxylesterase